MSGDFWFKKSILSFCDHRRAAHLLRCSLDEMGITPGEVHALARDEALDHFRENPLGWTETQIIELVDSASEPAQEVAERTRWIPIVVVEISEQGDGLNWLDGQGDLSAPGDDLFWVVLDLNADPEHNLELLGEVKKHRLEPRFAASIEEKIREYQE